MHIMNPTAETLLFELQDELQDENGEYIPEYVRRFLSTFDIVLQTEQAKSVQDHGEALKKAVLSQQIVSAKVAHLQDGTVVYDVHLFPHFSYTAEDGYAYVMTHGDHVFSPGRYSADLVKALNIVYLKLQDQGFLKKIEDVQDQIQYGL